MKEVLFIDFEDSFSYNVIQELEELKLEVEVLHWRDFKKISDHDLLVLGPGPGHPDDYQVLLPLIKDWRNSGKKIFGICLGHQILWRLLGGEVRRSSSPLHGQQVSLQLDQEWQNWLELSTSEVKVQRYNSLAAVKTEGIIEGLKMLIQNSEIQILKSSEMISYQFHPESVGTMCRQAFFRPLLRDLL